MHMLLKHMEDAKELVKVFKSANFDHMHQSCNRRNISSKNVFSQLTFQREKRVGI